MDSALCKGHCHAETSLGVLVPVTGNRNGTEYRDIIIYNCLPQPLCLIHMWGRITVAMDEMVRCPQTFTRFLFSDVV